MIGNTMEYKNLTQYAGWFTATPDQFRHHIVADHYIDWRKMEKNGAPIESTPHYMMPKAFNGFVFDLIDYPESRDYEKTLGEMDITIELDRAALSKIDVSMFNAKQILAILRRLAFDKAPNDQMLYEAAASTLLDRCLYKLKDIELMSRPPGFYDYKGYKTPNWRERPKKESWELYDEDNLPESVWCVIGNIVDEHPYGTDQKIVHGTKHFSPGTKVYCMPRNMDDRLVVIGRPRGRHGLIKIILDEKLIENFRCKRVYSPQVISKMYEDGSGSIYSRPWGPGEDDREYAEDMAAYLNMTEEDFRCEWVTSNFSTFTISSQIVDDPSSAVTLRILQKERSDGCLGSACYGFYTIGDNPEMTIGLIDWYGYWPEGKTYEESKDTFHDANEFIEGLNMLKPRLWDEMYNASRSNGLPEYTWSIMFESERGTLQRQGKNAYPEDLPSLYKYLHTCGFPKVWDPNTESPSALL